jgi:hypothetical protein
VIRKLYRHLHEQPIDPLAAGVGIRFLHVRTWWARTNDSNANSRIRSTIPASAPCAIPTDT